MTPWHADMAGKLKQAAAWLRSDVKMPGLADACEAGSTAILGAHARDNEVFEHRQEIERLRAENEKLTAEIAALKQSVPEASRRERSATAAMQGILAGMYADKGVHVIHTNEVAKQAARCADALIAELDKVDK